MVGKRNQLCSPKASEILEKLSCTQEIDASYRPFGDGHSAEKIIEIMEEQS